MGCPSEKLLPMPLLTSAPSLARATHGKLTLSFLLSAPPGVEAEEEEEAWRV